MFNFQCSAFFVRGLKLSAVSSVFTVVTACTWVEPIDDSATVALTKPSTVRACNSLGRATVSVKHKLWIVPRNAEKVKIELLILARNEAARMGGDTIVETIPVKNGSQTFAVYYCQSNLALPRNNS